MGRGDKRTKRGKIWRGSKGNSRPAKGNRPKKTRCTTSYRRIEFSVFNLAVLKERPDMRNIRSFQFIEPFKNLGTQSTLIIGNVKCTRSYIMVTTSAAGIGTTKDKRADNIFGGRVKSSKSNCTA